MDFLPGRRTPAPRRHPFLCSALEPAFPSGDSGEPWEQLTPLGGAGGDSGLAGTQWVGRPGLRTATESLPGVVPALVAGDTRAVSAQGCCSPRPPPRACPSAGHFHRCSWRGAWGAGGESSQEGLPLLWQLSTPGFRLADYLGPAVSQYRRGQLEGRSRRGKGPPTLRGNQPHREPCTLSHVIHR